MLVEIYSDVVCPWCAIGKVRFEKALARLEPAQRERIAVVWRPHQLDPNAPSIGMPVFDAYAKKFGGPDKAAAIIDRVTSVAADEGLTFHMDRAIRANTFDCHRLIAQALLVGGPGLQYAMKQRLLDAYFSEGCDVGDRAMLADAAVAVGVFLDVEMASLFLESGDLVAETRSELADGFDKGVSAVPTFVFDSAWMVPGAQDTDVFVNVLNRLLAREDEALGLVTGATCEVDEVDC